MNDAPAIGCVDVAKSFGHVDALRGATLTVFKGKVTVLFGDNGAGKSTLLRVLCGIHTPDRGQVFIDGTDIATMSDRHITELRRRRLGFVFQFFNLIPVLTVAENAALPLTLDGVSAAQARAKATEWLEKVGLGAKSQSRPDQLSGGQQQRVAVARALVTDPALLLADEPTGNLDTKSAEEIADLLKQAAEKWGRAVVMVTHDPRIAAHAGRIVFMRDGSVVDDVKMSGEDHVASARVAMEKAGLL